MNQGLGVGGAVRVDTGGENRIQYYQKIKDMTANRGNKIPSDTKLQELSNHILLKRWTNLRRQKNWQVL